MQRGPHAGVLGDPVYLATTFFRPCHVLGYQCVDGWMVLPKIGSCTLGGVQLLSAPPTLKGVHLLCGGSFTLGGSNVVKNRQKIHGHKLTIVLSNYGVYSIAQAVAVHDLPASTWKWGWHTS